jgi:hypothetical protein
VAGPAPEVPARSSGSAATSDAGAESGLAGCSAAGSRRVEATSGWAAGPEPVTATAAIAIAAAATDTPRSAATRRRRRAGRGRRGDRVEWRRDIRRGNDFAVAEVALNFSDAAPIGSVRPGGYDGCVRDVREMVAPGGRAAVEWRSGRA